MYFSNKLAPSYRIIPIVGVCVGVAVGTGWGWRWRWGWGWRGWGGGGGVEEGVRINPQMEICNNLFSMTITKTSNFVITGTLGFHRRDFPWPCVSHWSDSLSNLCILQNSFCIHIFTYRIMISLGLLKRQFSWMLFPCLESYFSLTKYPCIPFLSTRVVFILFNGYQVFIIVFYKGNFMCEYFTCVSLPH